MSNREIETPEKMIDGFDLSVLLREKVFDRIINNNPELSDLPDVLTSTLWKISRSCKDVERMEWTGSLERFAAGFGVMDRYWQGKNGAAGILNRLNDPGNTNGILKKVALDLFESDLDMDVCFHLKPETSLIDLYYDSKDKFKDHKNFEEKDEVIGIQGKAFDKHTFAVDLNNKYRMSFCCEPIITNPDLDKITIKFLYSSDNCTKPIIHVDVSRFPNSGVEAITQKRHGGRTAKFQDYGRIPLTTSDDERIAYYVTDKARSAFDGQESIDISGKDITGIVELGLRALRAKLIHVPEKLPLKINYLSLGFSANTIFSIRQKTEESVILNQNLSMKDMYLGLKDLVLCFNYDPYITLQFLQDSGLYILIPGLKSLSSKDWHNLYLSEWLNLTTEDELFLSPDKRSLDKLYKDQEEYKARGLSDGLMRVVHAVHEINNNGSKFDLENAFSKFIESDKVCFNTEKMTTIESSRVVSYILSYFKGGLTEIEIHRIYNSLVQKRIDREGFRKIFQELKLTSQIDKQLHLVKDGRKNKSVIFYTLRKAKSPISVNILDTYLPRILKDDSGHAHINRAREYFTTSSFQNPESSEDLLNKTLDCLRAFGVNSLEALRSLSPKDFSDILNNSEEDLSSDDDKISYRTLQILSEDILRYPKLIFVHDK